MPDSIIKTSALSYSYSKDIKTLFDINLDVKRGTIYGFLGPNGSGKTTTLALLLGLLQGAEGEIRIFDRDASRQKKEILKKIGSLIEAPSLYGHLTAKENLEVYRSVYEVSYLRIEEVLKLVGLGDTKAKMVKQFSLGMKQRLAVALALLPNPELLILDEPTNGLDPTGIVEFRELIKRLNRTQEITILVSSHILSEVEKMVSHIGIIFKGKMVFQGAISELHGLQKHQLRLLLNTSDNNTAIRILEQYQPTLENDSLSIHLSDAAEAATISRKLIMNNVDIYMLHPIKNDLEQLYINLTTTNA
jgi:ABC-2 type transport system ATP-binding protein